MSDLPAAAQGTELWRPSRERAEASRLAAYQRWLQQERGLSFESYEDLHAWSCRDLEGFWGSLVDFLELRFHEAPRSILGSRAMPGADWLPGATLNYAEHALGPRGPQAAVVARSEGEARVTLSRDDLARLVARAQAGLRAAGVGVGDRVVAFAGNTVEALVGFLAAAGLGATWSSCSPEFGVSSVLDRFAQVEPVVLLAVGSSRYGGRLHDRRDVVDRIREGLPTVRTVVALPGPGETVRDATPWEDFLGQETEPEFRAVSADHPLWILYSSGTTGLPKAIVQGHGGILLEHAKALALHCDLSETDRFFWYTTTGWMMWNFLVSGLLVGSTIVLYDGSPMSPDATSLWRMAAEEGVTYFGTSAPFLLECRKRDLEPGAELDLGRLRAVGSTGAPLPPEGFAWVYERVGPDLLLGSVSGGTDVCTAFVLSCPTRPVRAGEIQCRGLGCAVEAFGEDGRAVPRGEVGELVLTEPLPSMPVRFWGDPDGRRLRESYFDTFPGTWRHGDWIEITPEGGCVITGRSDSTLNRGGVRMGTSEFYRVVEDLTGVKDSLVVETGADASLWLFVVPTDGDLTEQLEKDIRSSVRESLSPRHVPDRILAVAEIPRTISGKKLEIPVKRILAGADPSSAASRDSLANPESLDAFIALAREGGRG